MAYGKISGRCNNIFGYYESDFVYHNIDKPYDSDSLEDRIFMVYKNINDQNNSNCDFIELFDSDYSPYEPLVVYKLNSITSAKDDHILVKPINKELEPLRVWPTIFARGCIMFVEDNNIYMQEKNDDMIVIRKYVLPDDCFGKFE